MKLCAKIAKGKLKMKIFLMMNQVKYYSILRTLYWHVSIIGLQKKFIVIFLLLGMRRCFKHKKTKKKGAMIKQQ